MPTPHAEAGVRCHTSPLTPQAAPGLRTTRSAPRSLRRPAAPHKGREGGKRPHRPAHAAEAPSARGAARPLPRGCALPPAAGHGLPRSSASPPLPGRPVPAMSRRGERGAGRCGGCCGRRWGSALHRWVRGVGPGIRPALKTVKRNDGNAEVPAWRGTRQRAPFLAALATEGG